MDAVEDAFPPLAGQLPEARRDHVLMLDARNIFRKVSRAVCDFSPEQQKNIAAIVWLYRGQSKRFLKLVGRFHASHGQAEPAGDNISSEPEIVAELAKAILVLNPKVDWNAWRGNYALVRDAIAETHPAIFKDFNERIKNPAGFDRPLPLVSASG
jgi:hypothetical protein